MHGAGLRGLRPEREGRDEIRPEIDGEDLHDGEGKRDPGEDEGEEGRELREIVGEDVRHELAHVRVDGAPLADGGDDRGEVVVGDDDVRRLFRHVAAALAHGHADVGGLQGRGVVDAVARHGHDLPEGLEAGHDGELVGG